MDFIDNQAEESDDSSVGSDVDEPQSKKRKLAKEKGKKKKRVVASSDEDEDDDDEEEGREEMKGFIADEEDEEEDAKSEKSDKSRHSGEDELDDEDLDLINENLDIHTGKKKNRVQLDDSDDEQPIRRDADDDDLLSERGSDDGHRKPHRGGYGSESERSEDDFIEDDGDAPRRHRKRHRGDEHMPEGAEEDARDVFGVEDFNFDEFYDDEDGEDGLEDEEEEIIEDDGEGGEIRIRRKKDTSKKTTLMEAIEPSELERGFLSSGDKKIMIEDAPERFQLRRTPVTEADDDEMDREANWILKFAFEEQTVTRQTCNTEYDRLEVLMNLDSETYPDQRMAVLNAIKEVLKFIRIRSNSFEVPFIGFYRKEFIHDLLNINHLWKVYDYDEKWCHLTEKKNKLYDLMRRMREYQELSDDLTAKRRPITDNDLLEINCAETLETLTDFHANFQLLYGRFLEEMTKWERDRRAEEGDESEYRVKFKSCIRNDKYQMCVENGIGELAGRFGLTAKQFAENLEWKKHDIEQDPMLPLEAAEEYVCAAFTDPETVLNGAKFMLAKEISRQPFVRHRIREEYRRNAHFWAKPTKKGVETIDENHPLFNKRYIKNKPIKELQDEEFLYYHKAKVDGLIDLIILYESDEDQESNQYLVNKFLSDSIFRKDEYSDNVEQWNALRDECVSIAINEMLSPYMKDELYNTLLEEAKLAVAKKCRQDFASRIARSGYNPENMHVRDDDDDEDMDRHGERRIMAIVYPTVRDEASFGVMVDENGSVVDYLRMIHFTKRSFGTGQNALHKAESMDLFKKFVQRRRPHAIALNIEDMECTKLKQDLETAINELFDKNAILRRPPVFLMDNEAAKVYMKSNISVAENPDHPPVLRQAVSLARLLLDPVPEYAHLWNADEDIFCLSLHPLQREIEQDVLANILCHELVNKINEEGVDINKCAEFPQYTNMLQFACGLGPRKATALLKTIKANDNLIESRAKLVTGCKLGPKVFMNCAGFIRIDTQKVSEKTDAYVEVLDGSRVHPETYEWARKMAVDALEVDDSADPTAALQEIMEFPDRLRDLDLDAFADELSRQGFGEKKATLYDISSELSGRYKDQRQPFTEPTEENLYDLLARSGKEIKVNQRILGTVQSVQYRKIDRSGEMLLPDMGEDGQFACPYCKMYIAMSPAEIQEHMNKEMRHGGCPGSPVGIRVRFDNGMTGFCPNKNISSSHVDNPLKRVKIGQPYYFKVLSIDKSRFSIFLSCKSTDLKEDAPVDRDEFWDDQLYQDDKDAMAQEVKKKKESNTRVKRVIAHPNFKNVSYERATRLLDEKDWSECIIRPSANKDSSLSVTWKICDGVYHNFFVKESAKDQVFSIGRQLTVGGEDFEDLDELIARFVQPMIQISHEITTHKYYFTDGTCEETEKLEAFVREKKRELGRHPYVFSASFRHPCQFCISYMFDHSERIRHEYFKILPNKVRFRHQNFDSLDQMIGWFKRHYHEAPPEFHRSAAPPSTSQPQFRSAQPPGSAHYYPPQFVGYH